MGQASLDAAVGALAERNRHHLESMDDAERADAVAHWHEIAVAVLAAASAAAGSGAGDPDGPGRAVIVLEDAGEEDVTIHVSFHPELEDLGDGQIAATPAQVTALELLDQLAGEPEG